jgi:Skp family chaperone for outer membrane proteins
VFIGAAALCVMLATAASFAQAPAPAQPAAPAAQAAPAPPRPFPAGTKYAFINIQRIAAESAEGKALAAKVQALNQKKVAELNDRNKQLQAAQQKLETGGSVLNPVALGQLQKEIERMQVDIQRFTEDAQQEVQQLQQELQEEFQRKLSPILDKVSTEKQLHMVFSAADAGLVWADLSLDITADVIREFDAASKSGALPPKPAAGAPAPKPAPAAPAPKPAPKPANP